MSVIDTADGILTVLETQDPRLSIIINALRLLRDAEDHIDSQQFQADRGRQLKAQARAETVATILGEALKLERMVDSEAERTSAEALAVARQRASEGQGVVPIDLGRLAAATSPADIVLVLRDAEMAGALSKAWAYAEPRLRALAAADARTGRLPHATSAFNALTIWGVRAKAGAQRVPDQVQIADRATREKQLVRQRILACCRVVSLDGAVEGAWKRAAATRPTPTVEPGHGSITIGGYWDRAQSKK